MSPDPHRHPSNESRSIDTSAQSDRGKNWDLDVLRREPHTSRPSSFTPGGGQGGRWGSCQHEALTVLLLCRHRCARKSTGGACVCLWFTRVGPTQCRAASRTRAWPSRGGCLPLSPGDARPPALCLPPCLHTFNAHHVARGAVVRSWIIPLSVWSGLCTLTFFTHVTSSGSANLCVQLSLGYPTLPLAFSCWWTFGWAPGSALGPVLPRAFAHGSAGAPGRAPRCRLWRSKLMTQRTGVRTNSAACKGQGSPAGCRSRGHKESDTT